MTKAFVAETSCNQLLINLLRHCSRSIRLREMVAYNRGVTGARELSRGRPLRISRSRASQLTAMPIIAALLLGQRLGLFLRSASVSLASRFHAASGMADGTVRGWCAPQAKEAPKLKLFNSFTRQKVSEDDDSASGDPDGAWSAVDPGAVPNAGIACRGTLRNICLNKPMFQ